MQKLWDTTQQEPINLLTINNTRDGQTIRRIARKQLLRWLTQNSMIYKGLYEKKIGGPQGLRSIDTRYFLRYSNHHKMAMLRV